MANNNMSVFTSALAKNMLDLQKQHLFQVIFEPTEGSSVAAIMDKESLILKAKSATMPGKSFSELTTEYLGSKLVMPGKATVDGEFTIKFDEFQDMEIAQTFHAWQQLMYNHGFKNDFARPSGAQTGGSTSNSMLDYTCKIVVRMWDSALKKPLPIEYHFYYCYPKDFQAAELDMEGDGKIQRSITFRYSTFEAIRNSL